ncbi:unnamed protein product [Parnassius apollo]|uniref:Decapping nuclease n=1 Tax=Parnassius apollo TaxID=110799 RepID=A0A8S3XD03_PARAO|nr:unnamed protein product [Parnassius apollo]
MINLLLQYLSDQKECLKISKNIDFICYRRTLISIMCNAFDEVKPLLISACLYNGSIYLCTLDTPQDIMKRKSRTKEEETFCAWGYKFEQYLLSDLPNTCPNIERPVIENEEFSLFYYASLGTYNLIYCAQIDGMLATNGAVPNPPANTDTECNLHYLRNNEYLELKTHRHILNQRQERNFRRYKMLLCWCQCYLANLKGLLVGFRTQEGIVERLQWYEQQEIVQYCKNEWNPEAALNYLNYFLSYIKNSFNQNICTGPVTLNFQLNSDKTINVIENPVCEILPQWYTTN